VSGSTSGQSRFALLRMPSTTPPARGRRGPASEPRASGSASPRPALEAFAERGFHGASTRDIAQRAGTHQGLITYHFRSKDELWRAAADRIFGMLHETLAERLTGLDPARPDAVETHAELLARLMVP
jgi:DNA-binding transcriptional regulator YbjK